MAFQMPCAKRTQALVQVTSELLAGPGFVAGKVPVSKVKASEPDVPLIGHELGQPVIRE